MLVKQAFHHYPLSRSVLVNQAFHPSVVDKLVSARLGFEVLSAATGTTDG
jgi:hypothetical protein